MFTNPEIVLNLTSSVNCRAFFDNVPVLHHVYINEFCAKNTMIADEMGEFDDWIEIYNAGHGYGKSKRIVYDEFAA